MTFTGAPHAVVKAAKPTGGAAIALHLYQALFGKAPGYAVIEVHPNLALFDSKTSGTEAIVGTVVNGGWTSYFQCR